MVHIWSLNPCWSSQKCVSTTIDFFNFRTFVKSQHLPAVCLQFFKNPLSLKHNLAFATWVQMFTISVLQPFTFDNVQIEHLALPKPKIVILLQSKLQNTVYGYRVTKHNFANNTKLLFCYAILKAAIIFECW